jgi:hypothetical protein
MLPAYFLASGQDLLRAVRYLSSQAVYNLAYYFLGVFYGFAR